MLAELARDPSPAAIPAWFASIAESLLTRSRLWIGSVPHEIREIEFYYHADAHPDPFSHRHSMQRSSGEWYLHRAGSSFRGGTFKGLDFTFGASASYGGVLLRSIETESGEFINGSGLCVEHILKLVGCTSVATLDDRIGRRPITDRDNPVRIESSEAVHVPATEIWSSARVGLTLKRLQAEPRMPEFIMRPYRFLTSPRAIKKGRLQLILAMLDRGLSIEEIRLRTASPRHAIETAQRAVQEGKRVADLAAFEGVHLGPTEYCRLYGFLQARNA